jgi:hypothetical protein
MCVEGAGSWSYLPPADKLLNAEMTRGIAMRFRVICVSFQLNMEARRHFVSLGEQFPKCCSADRTGTWNNLNKYHKLNCSFYRVSDNVSRLSC